MAVSLFVLATLLFGMFKLVPGDEARVAAGETASAEQVALVRERLGLDESIASQYVSYLGRLAHGDLGSSILTFRPVMSDLQSLLPSTLELVIFAMMINLALALPSGAFAALHYTRPVDTASRLFAVVAAGIPIFWFAVMAQYYLSSRLQVLPISGQLGFGFSVPRHAGMVTVDALIAGDFAAFWDAIRHLVLPATVLAIPFAAQLFRTVRASLLSVLSQEYTLLARAKGASDVRILLRHAFPNSLSPVVDMAGLEFGGMIGAAILVETVFARSGIGLYLADTVIQKDVNAALGCVLFVGVAIALANLATDVIQLSLDPQVRASRVYGRP